MQQLVNKLSQQTFIAIAFYYTMQLFSIHSTKTVLSLLIGELCLWLGNPHKFCCVLGKDTSRYFPLLGGLDKQF